MKVRSLLIPITIACALVFGTAAKCDEGGKDAPRKDSDEKSPALVIRMPDGFSNVATKCVDGVRYAVLFHSDSAYGSVSMVIDPACAK